MDLKTAAIKLRNFFNAQQRLPSYQEMCLLFGFSSKKTAFAIAKKLIAVGVLEKDSQGRLLLKQRHSLPFLGAIHAGFATAAEEQLYHTMSFDQYLIDKPENSFVLKVSGDSMVNAGIQPGDLVIIEKDTPKEGDIVVAYIDNQWTLKYLQYQNGKPYLMPANPNYPPIYPQQELQIWGIVRSVVRKYN